jgi:hypothetical protein
VGTLDHAAARRYCPAGKPIHAKEVQSDGGARDIDDAVESAYLMEMDAFQRHAMGLGLCLGQPSKNAKRQLALPIGETATREDLFHIGQEAMALFLGRFDVDRCGGETAFTDLFDIQADWQPERVHSTADCLKVDACINQGGQRHVAANAAETVKVSHAHGSGSPPG